MTAATIDDCNPVAKWLIGQGLTEVTAFSIVAGFDTQRSQLASLSPNDAAATWQRVADTVLQFWGALTGCSLDDSSAFLDQLERAGYMTASTRESIRGLAN